MGMSLFDFCEKTLILFLTFVIAMLSVSHSFYLYEDGNFKQNQLEERNLYTSVYFFLNDYDIYTNNFDSIPPDVNCAATSTLTIDTFGKGGYSTFNLCNRCQFTEKDSNADYLKSIGRYIYLFHLRNFFLEKLDKDLNANKITGERYCEFTSKIKELIDFSYFNTVESICGSYHQRQMHNDNFVNWGTAFLFLFVVAVWLYFREYLKNKKKPKGNKPKCGLILTSLAKSVMQAINLRKPDY